MTPVEGQVLMDDVAVEVVDPGLMPVWLPAIEVPVRLTVRVVREHRDHCANCGQRRVLYRIQVGSGRKSDTTERRCALCWGIR